MPNRHKYNLMGISSGKLRFPLIFLVTLTSLSPQGALSLTQTTNNSHEARTSDQIILRAARAVDEAWEVFHQAAIEGTLASPAIQGQIERQLHEARGLIMEARIAERANDQESVQVITGKIFTLAELIIQASRERKQ